jgi:hypothetical protein
MIVKGLDAKGQTRKIETKFDAEWWELKPMNQYYIDGIKVTKEEAEKLFEEIKNVNPHLF